MSNASYARMHRMFAWSSCQEHRRPLSGRALSLASARCRAMRQTAIVPGVPGIPDITGNTFVVFPFCGSSLTYLVWRGEDRMACRD